MESDREEIVDQVSDWLGQSAAYGRDPYAYHGVSRKDF